MKLPAASRIVCSVLPLLLSGCDDADVRVCFGSASFCEAVISQNSAPVADAGNDQEVAGGAMVMLDGSASMDPDGHISSFSWVQTEGQSVTLLDADTAVARFDAPDVPDETTLVFELTVVDNHQAADQDSVAVRILPRTALAVQNGVDLLSRSLAPLPLSGPDHCIGLAQPSGQGWFAYAGAWLAVLGRSLSDDADPVDVTRYLDAARVLLAQANEGEATDAVATALWQHGLNSLYRFAQDRDPGVAEWSSSMRAPGRDDQLIASIYRGKTILQLNRPDVPTLVVNSQAAAVDAELATLIGLDCTDLPDPLRVASTLMRLQVSMRNTAPG